MIQYQRYTDLTFDEFVYWLNRLSVDDSIEFIDVDIVGKEKLGFTISDLRFVISVKIK